MEGRAAERPENWVGWKSNKTVPARGTEVSAMCEQTGLPPSALYIEDKLEAHGPMTHKEIADETRMAKSTVTDGLTDLRDAGVVEKRYDTSRGSYVYGIV